MVCLRINSIGSTLARERQCTVAAGAKPLSGRAPFRAHTDREHTDETRESNPGNPFRPSPVNREEETYWRIEYGSSSLFALFWGGCDLSPLHAADESIVGFRSAKARSFAERKATLAQCRPLRKPEPHLSGRIAIFAARLSDQFARLLSENAMFSGLFLPSPNNLLGQI